MFAKLLVVLPKQHFHSLLSSEPELRDEDMDDNNVTMGNDP